MKNVIDRMTVTLGTLLVLGASLGRAQAAGATVSYDWRFDTTTNPDAPEAASGGAGTAQATVVEGDFASGWIAHATVFGQARGVWDLGRSGRISLSNAAGLAGSSSQARVLTVSVVQYQDGSIYDQLAAVSVPGATLVSSSGTYATASSVGGWLTHVSQWSVPAGTAVPSVVVSGAYSGSVIDEVSLQATASVVTQPPTLSIQAVGTQVQLSWAAGSPTDWVVESSTDINNPQGWAPVAGQVQVNNGVATVQTGMAGAARFYRLKQP